MPGVTKLRQMKRLLVLGFAGMAAQPAYAADRQWLYGGDRFGPRAYLTAIAGAGTEAAIAEAHVDRASAEEASRQGSSMLDGALRNNPYLTWQWKSMGASLKQQ